MHGPVFETLANYGAATTEMRVKSVQRRSNKITSKRTIRRVMVQLEELGIVSNIGSPHYKIYSMEVDVSDDGALRKAGKRQPKSIERTCERTAVSTMQIANSHDETLKTLFDDLDDKNTRLAALLSRSKA